MCLCRSAGLEDVEDGGPEGLPRIPEAHSWSAGHCVHGLGRERGSPGPPHAGSGRHAG